MRKFQTHLLAGAATALCLAGAAPAAAQTAAGAPAPAPAATPSKSRLEPMSAKRTIRPFAGPIGLSNARTTTFAGDVTGTATRIRAFEDKVGTSATRIRAFAGELSGFATRIRAFYADPTINSYNINTTNSFWGGLYGSANGVTASATRIRAFDGNFEAYATRIRAFGDGLRAADGTLLSFTSAPTNYEGIRREIFGLVAATKGVYGATVQARTLKTFEAGFSDPMLAKWGIRLNDASSIAGMNEVDLQLFLLDWRDNALVYSGVDSVDHWMGAINWAPATAHQLMGGKLGEKPRVGLIDFALDGKADVRASLVLAGGHLDTGAHGAAVGSLIAAPHDGRGVMGVAPNAALYHYNPFDHTQTGSWEDVRNGLVWLSDETKTKIDASVVNMSLGVSGSTFHRDWQPVLSFGDVKNGLQDAVFVIAAGNDGITQTEHVNMKDALQNPFLVVGSVGPDGKISAFSNKPGATCLTDQGDCKNTARWAPPSADLYKTDYLKESGLLMNRFIVAPGEFMLVDDGKGGVTRMSGTSFAAPLVAGAVALIQERWPWMIDKPRDVAHVILTSARDLGVNGAPDGVDGVYGRGMLDIQAAMAPLDWNRLTIKQHSIDGTKDVTFAGLRATTSTERSNWQAKGAYFYLFEKLADSTRDFYVPMSSTLVGRTVGDNTDQMNWYLQSRFRAALGPPARFAGTEATTFGPRRIAAPMAGFGELAATVSVTPRAFRPGLRQGTAPFDTALALQGADGRFAVRFGSGDGGAAVDGQTGFGFQSDRDIDQGGANPYLGLASGAGYVAADVKLTGRLTLTAGVSGDRMRRDLDRVSLEERRALGQLEPYAATASMATLDWRANRWLRASLGYTLLDEGSGLLGVQSLNGGFAHGSTTDAATLGAEATPGHGLAVSLSGTLGRTRAADLDRQAMGVGGGGLLGTAFQVAVSKNGVVDGRDRARVTFAQPLHVENGSLAVNQVQVVDRRTGEIGTVLETFEIDGGRRAFVAEAMYGRSVLGDRGEFGLFGRARLRDDDARQSALTLGGNFRLAF